MAITAHLRHIHRRSIALLIGGLLAICLLILLVSLFWPRTIQFSYAGQHCSFNPILLPGLHGTKSAPSFDVAHRSAVSLFGYPLVSNQTCVSVAALPKQNSEEKLSVHLLRLPFPKQSIRVITGEMPKLHTASTHLPELISIKDPIILTLNQRDDVFDYQLATKGGVVNCKKNDRQLTCDTNDLGLAQAKSYELTIRRLFRDEISGNILKQTVKTVTPVEVVAQSIASGVIVYDKPTQFVLTTNKKLSSYDDISLVAIDANGQKKPLNVKPALVDKSLVLTFSASLPRQSTIELKIAELHAIDQGFLNQPLVYRFSTSGGPKVVGGNIANYGMSTGSTLRLNFDSELSSGQNLGQLVSLTVNNAQATFSASSQGNILYIKPTAILPVCANFSVKINDSLQNIHGVSGGSGYTINSRTLCQQVFSIGTSAQGRAITAYRFGSGATKIVFVGATHGDEAGSKYLLDSWVDELEALYHKIPANRTIVVIPAVSPDGFANRTRMNARNVDLNRNFPANDWKADVTMPGGNLVVGGGGSAALSEPESSALASYILAQQPRLTLTYHSKGSMVIANESGDSAALAGIYAGKSNYWARTESQLGSTFAYDTTGAFENWLHQKHGLPVLLIELSSHSGNEFWRNKSAMWAMLGI